MTPSPKPWIPFWNLAVGAMDACTGILLMVAPAFTLRLMKLEVPAGILPFIGWIGAFVFAVGSAYFFALRSPGEGTAMVWRITAFARTVVAGYLVWKISTGSLSTGWATVAATDAVVAMVQWIGLKRRWLS